MPRLVLINGAPGVGKSTLAQRLAHARPMSLALDIDAIKHAVGDWQQQMPESGIAARRLALAMACEHLGAGLDVFVGQYLPKGAFIIELESLAGQVSAEWHEIVLAIEVDALSARLSHRHRAPGRAEHAINNAMVGPEDASVLVDSMEALIKERPATVRIDASGDADETLRKVEISLAAGGDDARSH